MVAITHAILHTQLVRIRSEYLARVLCHLTIMALAELLTDASATLAEFNRNQLAPAILKAAKNFNEFNSQHMSPALTEAGKHLAAFGVNHLTPALQQVGAGAREFGNQHAAPALTEVGKRLDGFGKSELGMALGEVGKSLEQASRIVMGPKLDEVVLPALNQTAEWVSSNPGWTALFTLGVMAPDVFTGPLYWVLGLGANGPIAGMCFLRNSSI